jgi:hypothetical protein
LVEDVAIKDPKHAKEEGVRYLLVFLGAPGVLGGKKEHANGRG